MKELIHIFSQGTDFQHVLKAIQNGMKEQLVTGLNGSSRTLFMSALFQENREAQLVVTHNLHQAQKIYEDLIEWLDEESVYLYPVNELIASEIATASPEFKRQRIEVLNKLALKEKIIVIVPLAGLKRLLPPPSVWKKAQISITWGDEINLEELQAKLLTMGYKRVEMVEAEGEYSIRGGIIDVYPPASSPVRIELFDTEVDSIRTFDIETQRSQENVQRITLGPSVEWILFEEHYELGAKKVEEALHKQLAKVRDEEVKAKLKEHIGWEIEQLRQKQSFQGIYKYISCFYGQRTTLVDYFEPGSVVIVDEPTRLLEAETNFQREEAEWKTLMMQTGEFLPELSISLPFSEWKEKVKKPLVYLSLFLRQIPQTSPQNIVHFTSKPMQHFHSQFPVLQTEINRWQKNRDRIVFLAGDSERVERMLRILDDFQIEARKLKGDAALVEGIPQVVVGRIQSGFELPTHRLVVVTENELFAQQKKRKPRTQTQVSNVERIKSYTDLNEGDYVVHVNHGIGRYVGLKTLEINGAHKDYLHIQYAGDDKLYVPVENIDQVQKYLGSEDKAPKLYRLGGNEWKRVKSRVRSSVQDIAEHLLKLYAKREATPGYAFSPDTEIHREFDALFPYEETPDQKRAIEEIKRDMEKPRPMDRLLCGDVGYGKTEVAIRAAFKAVMDSKQVAVLVPTTILAQQHYETFKERFRDFPVEIDVLSRFRTRKEQNETVKRIKNGVVDIIIGTHRLLSKDVQFKDLGLLIVDEEQRFGVAHKEKIKQLKANVDVLTLTATPIPRTLHMSMLGVRDLSVIETPPENRFPVQTYVVEYQGALVREAIERELARGGQVYFVYNQVQGIERKAEEIRALVPDARVAVAHGQMKETELEAIMLDFLDGEYDVLVSTTIIETGVDIPNVNTLIVYDADKMGLSQLYQLRGRVGRSNRTAYAYFTYQRGKVLSEVAEKRLEAIKEFTELGSGFKIAMRDLAIRGAGNLLGAEQHGFINSVGFDLYSQMLKEAIEELKGERPQEEPVELEMDVHIDAYIPEDYVQDSKQKIEMYKKVAAVSTLEDVREVEEEFMDRFGAPPPPVGRLIKLSKLKAYAKRYKLDTIVLKDQVLRLLFHPSQNDKIDGGQLFKLASQYGRRVGLVSDVKIGVTVKVNGMSEDEWLDLTLDLFDKMAEANVVKGEESNAQHNSFEPREEKQAL
ncbi:transcription-repair-coupling factor [Caldalkalibacillus thermarum]|uniref:transcription-repair coupling factor n=1 Tax=Caldalkalibacillus thermarum TaxID=296745 RepID=UPI00166C8E3A|nr:transcription-repair coupling factor [Caldalkalibacillus thermarum]GGK32071.1 transcription-repair-coupling factor [Caldalkalibacillus thermarum]